MRDKIRLNSTAGTGHFYTTDMPMDGRYPIVFNATVCKTPYR